MLLGWNQQSFEDFDAGFAHRGEVFGDETWFCFATPSVTIKHRIMYLFQIEK
jgi:hypothetical protein